MHGIDPPEDVRIGNTVAAYNAEVAAAVAVLPDYMIDVAHPALQLGQAAYSVQTQLLTSSDHKDISFAASVLGGLAANTSLYAHPWAFKKVMTMPVRQ